MGAHAERLKGYSGGGKGMYSTGGNCIEITLIDRDAIIYLVDGLDDFEKDRAIRAGLAAAAGVFRTKGRSNLRNWMGQHGHPNGVKGNLLAAFKIRVKKNKPGVLSGFELPKGSHVWLVDQGTSRRFTTGAKSMRAGISRGIMPASYFWKDARISEEPKAMQRLRTGIERAIQRINERRK